MSSDDPLNLTVGQLIKKLHAMPQNTLVRVAFKFNTADRFGIAIQTIDHIQYMANHDVVAVCGAEEGMRFKGTLDMADSDTVALIEMRKDDQS